MVLSCQTEMKLERTTIPIFSTSSAITCTNITLSGIDIPVLTSLTLSRYPVIESISSIQYDTRQIVNVEL